MPEQILREVNAPYTVDPDDEAIGRETIIIRRNGEAVAAVVPLAASGQLAETVVTEANGNLLGAIVPPAEYAAYRAWKEQNASQPVVGDSPFERERAAFQKLLPELLKTHSGQWVAIVDEQPVQFGLDFKSVILPVRQKYGKRPVYVREILERPRVHKMLSPRIVRR